jgi:hypothetical protein
MSDPTLVVPIHFQLSSLLHRAQELMTVAEHWNEEADRAKSIAAVREARQLLSQAGAMVRILPRR